MELSVIFNSKNRDEVIAPFGGFFREDPNPCAKKNNGIYSFLVDKTMPADKTHGPYLVALKIPFELLSAEFIRAVAAGEKIIDLTDKRLEEIKKEYATEKKPGVSKTVRAQEVYRGCAEE
jgi:hypothetical protein